jgi:hypothetical protein
MREMDAISAEVKAAMEALAATALSAAPPVLAESGSSLSSPGPVRL